MGFVAIITTIGVAFLQRDFQKTDLFLKEASLYLAVPAEAWSLRLPQICCQELRIAAMAESPQIAATTAMASKIQIGSREDQSFEMTWASFEVLRKVAIVVPSEELRIVTRVAPSKELRKEATVVLSEDLRKLTTVVPYLQKLTKRPFEEEPSSVLAESEAYRPCCL